MTYHHKNASYDVGYGKPPKSSQFKPGNKVQSQGKKPKPKNLEMGGSVEEMLAKLLLKTTSVSVSGKSVKMPFLQALLQKSLVNVAEGTAKEQLAFMKLVMSIPVINEQLLLTQTPAIQSGIFTPEQEAAFLVIDDEFRIRPAGDGYDYDDDDQSPKDATNNLDEGSF
ncbi:DUF5681 domain-containing protein [Sphingomonas prati]|uniref:DUF5681 domain-containing protein n=1 Tax=Sphingomonas prati TaxID=1843237 RepID=A0A7W9BVN4_9SPHN|nr:DUF5681 domain-containing protein [Sphingomonas prati]MBB5730935.1 hypothetical protein [Sphingomonas prati]GGE97882.1 hypothetical protein GCM10011404_33770 [Sphingomonas prati]